MPDDPILVVKDLGVDYGGGEVVRGLDLDIRPAEVFAVIGPNGAGKTSTLTAIVGLSPTSRGDVTLDGRKISGWRTDRIAKAGLVFIPDDRGLFPSMTVEDHFWLSLHSRPKASDLAAAFDLFPILQSRRRQVAGSLSGGEAQMLSIAVGLLLKPRVLLIDDLSFGLAPIIVGSLMQTCRRLADEQNVAVVIVDQFVDLVLEVADRAVLLADGTSVLAGTGKELASDRERLREAYLGGRLRRAAPDQ